MQDKKTINTPAYQSSSGNYIRNVDTGRNIGIDKTTKSTTNTMTVITDKKGNLVTTYPSEPKP